MTAWRSLSRPGAAGGSPGNWTAAVPAAQGPPGPGPPGQTSESAGSEWCDHEVASGGFLSCEGSELFDFSPGRRSPSTNVADRIDQSGPGPSGPKPILKAVSFNTARQLSR
jgi:hypothetical protein